MVFGAFPSFMRGRRRWRPCFSRTCSAVEELIDAVDGACMATAFFYLFLPDEFKGAGALAVPYNFTSFVPGYVGGQRAAAAEEEWQHGPGVGFGFGGSGGAYEEEGELIGRLFRKLRMESFSSSSSGKLRLGVLQREDA
ncbi:hypothetical protein FA15DRAFT_706294 [Coprinopsis marcescibilis]|uniref:Uncharacterized protein n=1 Tax=Coprinopsis marcescibilis TaxID=230819 RepID=A0A5C3KQ67_COPMA|nr:hypothetical protein FA15DRAFT_706294 [Coprinopsis marcescibilis]